MLSISHNFYLDYRWFWLILNFCKRNTLHAFYFQVLSDRNIEPELQEQLERLRKITSVLFACLRRVYFLVHQVDGGSSFEKEVIGWIMCIVSIIIIFIYTYSTRLLNITFLSVHPITHAYLSSVMWIKMTFEYERDSFPSHLISSIFFGELNFIHSASLLEICVWVNAINNCMFIRPSSSSHHLWLVFVLAVARPPFGLSFHSSSLSSLALSMVSLHRRWPGCGPFCTPSDFVEEPEVAFGYMWSSNACIIKANAVSVENKFTLLISLIILVSVDFRK